MDIQIKEVFTNNLHQNQHLALKRIKILNQGFASKISSASTDFERRKLAEQRATKRLKEDTDGKERKSKSGYKKKRG